MRVGIVGWRDYPNMVAVAQYVDGLPDGTVVVSGGARGVDSWAVARAKARGLAFKEYPADWDQHGKAAGPIRNAAIVADADKIVAFWDGASKGTADTIRKAKRAGKFLGWFDTAGEWHDERTARA